MLTAAAPLPTIRRASDRTIRRVPAAGASRRGDAALRAVAASWLAATGLAAASPNALSASAPTTTTSTTTTTVSGTGAASAEGPPSGYPLDRLSLSVQRLHGHGQPQWLYEVAGDGRATLKRVDRPSAAPRTTTLPRTAVVELVDGLYRARFFDLPPRVGPAVSVHLRADGTVATQSAQLADVTTTTVCLRVPARETCVRYASGNAPRELEAWVQAALDDAVRRMPTDGPQAQPQRR